jgi:hypothetical protein
MGLIFILYYVAQIKFYLTIQLLNLQFANSLSLAINELIISYTNAISSVLNILLFYCILHQSNSLPLLIVIIVVIALEDGILLICPLLCVDVDGLLLH